MHPKEANHIVSRPHYKAHNQMIHQSAKMSITAALSMRALKYKLAIDVELENKECISTTVPIYLMKVVFNISILK